jgi:hypothetical protein
VTSFSLSKMKKLPMSSTPGIQMKGTAPQTSWPTPADTQTPTPMPGTRPEKAMTRITLALLDEYSEHKGRGYNPYDTGIAARSPDVWRRKPKRD